MSPKTDEAGIRQVIRALRAAGHKLLYVFDGEEDIPVRTEAEAMKAITDVEDAFLHVTPVPGHHITPWVRFVLGNAPDEVVCDYTLSLDPVLGPLTDGWVE